MTEPLKQLIETLREELQNYGELLALLDQQQEQVVNREANEILLTVNAINTQQQLIGSLRAQRQKLLATLIRSLKQPDEITFEELLPFLPEDYRPLLQALVNENNELVARVQKRVRQNHMLLTRSLELMQGLLLALLPNAQLSTYNGAGCVSAPAGPAAGFYEAVG